MQGYFTVSLGDVEAEGDWLAMHPKAEDKHQVDFKLLHMWLSTPFPEKEHESVRKLMEESETCTTARKD